MSLDRQEARVACRVAEAVPQFALTEVGEGLVQSQVHQVLRSAGDGGCQKQSVDLREGLESAFVLTGLETVDAEREVKGDEFRRIPVGGDLAFQSFDFREGEERVP
jgi:hypothetical protein